MYVKLFLSLVLLLGGAALQRVTAQDGGWTLVREREASDVGFYVRAAHASGYVLVAAEDTRCGNHALPCWTRLQSHDHGATWERVRDSVGVGIHTADVSAYPEVLVGGSFGVFRSRDAGRSWTLIRSQIQDAYFANDGFRTISRWGRDTLLVANNFGDSQNKQASEFWYSTDDGRSWRWSYWGQQGGYMLAALTGPAEPVVFFERRFFHSEPLPPAQWRFRQIWDLGSTTPSPTAVLRLVRGPVRAGQRPVLYAGFGGISFSAPHPGPAVARSRDGGRSWAVLPSQPAAGTITDMAINARGALAVAARGRACMSPTTRASRGDAWARRLSATRSPRSRSPTTAPSTPCATTARSTAAASACSPPRQRRRRCVRAQRSRCVRASCAPGRWCESRSRTQV